MGLVVKYVMAAAAKQRRRWGGSAGSESSRVFSGEINCPLAAGTNTALATENQGEPEAAEGGPGAACI